MGNDRNVREVGVRIEALLDDLGSVSDAPTRQRAEDLVRLLVELYGAGLERIVEMLSERGVAGRELLLELAEDRFVASLLVLHGLHPVDVDTRIHEALEKVRPYLGSHAGGVEYLGIDDEGVVRLKLEGSCDGCPSSTVTVKLAIERAIEEVAPEMTGIDVEGVAEPEPTPALLQVGPLRSSETAAGDGKRAAAWTALDGQASVPPGEMRRVDLAGLAVLLLSAKGALFAYVDECASCGAQLNGGRLEDERLSCPSCAEVFDVRLAGRSTARPDVHLRPLPLLQDEHGWNVAVPEGVGS